MKQRLLSLPRVFCRLIDLVNEDVERPTRRSHPLPTSKQVLKYCGARVRHLLHVHVHICDTLKEFLATLKNPLKNWITYEHYLLNSHFLDKKSYISTATKVLLKSLPMCRIIELLLLGFFLHYLCIFKDNYFRLQGLCLLFLLI